METQETKAKNPWWLKAIQYVIFLYLTLKILDSIITFDLLMIIFSVIIILLWLFVIIKIQRDKIIVSKNIGIVFLILAIIVAIRVVMLLIGLFIHFS